MNLSVIADEVAMKSLLHSGVLCLFQIVHPYSQAAYLLEDPLAGLDAAEPSPCTASFGGDQ
jgi:hypothetical protein